MLNWSAEFKMMAKQYAKPFYICCENIHHFQRLLFQVGRKWFYFLVFPFSRASLCSITLSLHFIASQVVLVFPKVIPFSCAAMAVLLLYFLFGFFSVTICFASLQDSAEADTFFCFVELLSGFRDNFVQQLDNSVVGIRATITRLSQMLKDHDEELWRHLELTTKVRLCSCCLIIDFMLCSPLLRFSIL